MSNTSVPESALAPRLRPLTIGLLAIITCVAFEAMAVVTAMPSVAAELNGESTYGLAFSMYLTASLLGTVLAGSWTDRQGPRPALAVGMALMIAGLLVSGAAPAFWMVTAGRAVSGLGGGFMIVAVYVIIGRAFPAGARPVVFGWLSAAWVVPSLVGPFVAGVVAEQLHWRWVFLGVAPLVAAAGLVVWPRVRSLGPSRGGGPARDEADADADADADAGAGTGSAGWQRALRGLGLSGGVFAVQWAVSRVAADDGISSGALAFLAVLAAAGLAAVFATLPGLLPRGTLTFARGLPSVIGTRGLVNVAFFGAEAFIPLMLVSARGFSSSTAGLALSAGALGWSLGAFLQSRVRFRRQWLLVAGSSLLSVALGGFALASGAQAPLPVLVLVWAFAGMAMGMTLSSTSVLVLELSPEAEQGRNSASLQIADQLGGVVGTAGAGVLFALLRDPAGPGRVEVFVAIWLALCLFSAAGIVSGLRGAQTAEAGPEKTPRSQWKVLSRRE